MRIWDQVPPPNLCDKHLLAQWREGLGLWSILANGKKGYANHPETKRWVGNVRRLWEILWLTRNAMLARGWNPKPMPTLGGGYAGSCDSSGQVAPWDDQLMVLKAKGCACVVPENKEVIVQKNITKSNHSIPLREFMRAHSPRHCMVCYKPESSNHPLEEIKNPAITFIANPVCAYKKGWGPEPGGMDYDGPDPPEDEA